MFFLTNPLRLHSGPLQFPNLKFHRAFFHVCLTGPTMKWLCLGTIGVAGLALLLCALDLITGVPFGGGFSTFATFVSADSAVTSVTRMRWSTYLVVVSMTGMTWNIPGPRNVHYGPHADEVLELGWEEALSGGISLVEWPERLGTMLPAARLDVVLSTDGATRQVKLYGGAKWKESNGAERYRRGLYTLFLRTTPHPQLMNFDAPDSMLSCSRRDRSTTPLQALNLLNDASFFEAAQLLPLSSLDRARQLVASLRV